jgi:hypothetical protein
MARFDVLVRLPTIQLHRASSYYTTMASTKQEIATLMADVTPWYKDPGRRKLYALLLIALLSSATNGYDGYVEIYVSMAPFYRSLTCPRSLMNGVKSITYYEKCKSSHIFLRIVV